MSPFSAPLHRKQLRERILPFIQHKESSKSVCYKGSDYLNLIKFDDMKIDSLIKEITRIIKTEPLSVLIFLSLIFLPFIISQWAELFPESWKVIVKVVIVIFWVIAFFMLRKEIKLWRKKTILVNYLKKETRHSINHLTKEWDGSKEFTEKDIKKLLSQYPDELKRVKMAKNKGEGVGLVKNTPQKS